MRFIPAIALTLLALALAASAATTPPITVAYELYSGCMNGMSSQYIPNEDKPTIHEFIKQADANCIIWMILWFKPIMEKELDLEFWPPSQIALLDARRRLYLLKYEQELRMLE